MIPGAAGYRHGTVAGRGGTVYKVTNLNASGAGSLKACVDGTTGPRICVFEVSGIIRLTSDLMIRNSKLTIAGQTAPSPGIMIRGAALRIQASDVLVQHIRVRAGDDPTARIRTIAIRSRSKAATTKPVKNIVIDHCSFSWAIDEIASVWGPHDNITFTNNIFSEPLNESIHPTDDGTGVETHGFGVLFGSSADGGRVTMVGNLLAHIVERNPLSRARELVFVNNLVYNRANMDVDLQSRGAAASPRTRSSATCSCAGPSFARDTQAYLRAHQRHLHAGAPAAACIRERQLRAGIGGTSISHWSSLTGGDVISGLLQTATAPVWNTGLTARAHGEQRGVQPRAAVRRRASHRSRHRRQAHRLATSRTATARSSTAWRRTAPRAAARTRAAGRRYAQNTRTAHAAVESEHAWRRTATPISRTGCIRMDQTLQGVTSVQRVRHRRRRCRCTDTHVGPASARVIVRR